VKQEIKDNLAKISQIADIMQEEIKIASDYNAWGLMDPWYLTYRLRLNAGYLTTVLNYD
jgi:hypothetical protein